MDSSIGADIVPAKTRFEEVGRWLDLFNDPDAEFAQRLEMIYGSDGEFLEGRKALFIEALRHFAALYGSHRKVAVVRAPCRINLRGMHSEMQHATPNYLTHGREIIMVAEKRDDDKVVLNNVDHERFGRHEFRISEEMALGKWGDWLEYIDSPHVRQAIEAERGNWSNYVKAAVLKLQDSFPKKRLNGMNIVTFGDVPRGSGLASSSAVVVSSCMACMAVNDLQMDRRELTVNMGRGEWYVGTRGGFGDHGAILFGKHGQILHCVFLTVEEMQPQYISLPEDYQVIIIRSYKTSTKSADRLYAYNKTMFAYSMAMALIKDVLAGMDGYDKEFVDSLNYLGEITPERFGLRRIYEILKALPEKISIDELKKRYSAAQIDSRLDRFFGQLDQFPDDVEVRGAALWGIAESERSRAFARLIQEENMEEAAELMDIGHNGDRLYTFGKDKEIGEHVDFTENKVTDDYLDLLIARLDSDDPAQRRYFSQAQQEILERLSEFKILGYPIMIGASRKTFIGNIYGKNSPLPVSERLEGSLEVASLAVKNGADIIRVHDVKETRDVIDSIKR